MHTTALKDKNDVAAYAGFGKVGPDCPKTEAIGSSFGEQQLQSD